VIAVQLFQIKAFKVDCRQERADQISEYLVSTILTQQPISPANLFALAVDHRLQAERATSPDEQDALHRVADIYTVLATMDMPAAMFEQMIP
jgi:hypothetical protein